MAAADQIKLAGIGKDIDYMKEKLDRIDAQLGANYVTKEEFEPIKKIVYGLVTLILTAVVTGIVALVINK